MRYGKCPKCKEEAIHFATANVHEFYGDQDDDEDEDSQWADELAPDSDLPVIIFAHICYGCGYLADVGIEMPRDKALDTSTRSERVDANLIKSGPSEARKKLQQAIIRKLWPTVRRRG